MATGFGADPMKNSSGAVTVGTTSADIRKIFGALYTPGLISGGAIKTNASDMSYSVAEGVGSIRMGAGEAVLGYWPAVNRLIVPAPTVVPRTDHIYAYQQTPAADGDATLRVEVGPTFPSSRAILLGSYTYRAGDKTSSAGISSDFVDYSIPYGASRGELAWLRNTHNGTFTTRQQIVGYNLTLPSDRLVMFNFSTVISTSAGDRFDNNHFCEASWYLKVDGVQVAKWQSPGLTMAWSTLSFDLRQNLDKGTHLITLDRGRESGPGTPFQHFGPAGTQGATLTITDLGVVR